MTAPGQDDSNSTDFPLPIGPCEVVSAKDLALRLKELTPAAARQAISRAAQKEIIWRSEHLQLPGGGRLYARHSFAGQERFLQQVRPLLANRPGIARVLDEMLRSPAVHQDTVAKLLAATLDPEKYPDQRSLADELLVLAELGIGKIDTFGNSTPRFVRPAIHEKEESVVWGHRLAGRKLLDQQLTKLLLQTYKRQNVVSWGYEPGADAEHQYNGQWFSAHGYCWLRPLITVRKGAEPAPCPVVFDVRSTAATMADVEAFAARVKNAGYRPNSDLRILGIMAARFFEPDAFAKGKNLGFVMVNFRDEIGDEALEALAAVDKIVSASPEAAGERPDFVDLFIKLRYHPQAKELASLAFEGFTTAVAQADGWDKVQSNLSVRFGDKESGTWRDVDVSGQRGDHHLAIECKAYSRTKALEVGDVTKFFKQTVPSYLKHYSQTKKVTGLTAEIWTTGIVTDECKAKLTEVQAEASSTHAYALRGTREIVIPTDVRSLEKLLSSIADL